MIPVDLSAGGKNVAAGFTGLNVANSHDCGANIHSLPRHPVQPYAVRQIDLFNVFLVTRHFTDSLLPSKESDSHE